MLVGVDEPGKEQVPAALVLALSRRLEARLQGGDALVLEGDVDRVPTSAQADVADDRRQCASVSTTASEASVTRSSPSRIR